MDTKLAQYNTLRNEIADILKNKTSAADMIIAPEKIIELQEKVDQLSNKTNEVVEENKRLNRLLKQLINERPKKSRDIKTIIEGNKASDEKNGSTSFAVSNLKLVAVSIDNDKEYETYQASKTDKLEGSFYVKNIAGQSNSFEMEVIILRPNGKVFQNSVWESGTFETPEGKKVYSVKLHFDYTKDGNPKMDFSLTAAKFQKGNYIMQIYHKGKMIARMVKTLA